MAKDEEFKQKVLDLAGQEVLTCIQCGTCSASCPYSQSYESQHPKIDQALSGGKERGGSA